MPSNSSVMSKQVQVLLRNKDSSYSIPPTNLSVSVSISWKELNKTLLALLREHETPVLPNNPEFDFLINDQLLISDLQEFIASNAIGTEQQIEIEYFERKPPPSQPHLLPHPDWVSALSLAGQRVLTGSYDGVARRWDLSTHSLLSEVKCHTEPISGIATLSEEMFVTASHDESVCFWGGSLSELPPHCLFRGHHSQPVACLAAGASGGLLASGSWDRAVKVWPVSSMLDGTIDTGGDHSQPLSVSPLSVLEGHTDTVSGCTWGRDRLVSCSWDQSIQFWDVSTEQSVRDMSSSRALLSVSESRLSGLVATGGSDNVVRVWNTRDSEPTVIRLVLRGHTGWVCSVVWSQKTEHQLISGSYDGSIKHWDIRNSKSPVYTVGAHKKKLLCLDWEDGGNVASGGEDSQLVVSRF